MMFRKLMAHAGIMARGFCMGAADVVPGVSGGTMAFILGIYTRLLDAVKSFDLQWVKHCLRLEIRPALTRPHFSFLIPLAIGLVLAIVFFTRVVPLPVYLHTHPERVYALFFGLVLGSIVFLQLRIRWSWAHSWLWLLLGLGAGVGVNSLVPTLTPETGWFVFLSGSVAITAMILPGVSGSFILLILNKYAYIFDALGRFDLSIIVPFALGCATGLVVFSRILSWLMHHYHQAMLLVINGFLLASLWKLWPWQARIHADVRGKQRLIESTPEWPVSLDAELAIVSLLLAAGCVAVIALNRLAGDFRH